MVCNYVWVERCADWTQARHAEQRVIVEGEFAQALAWCVYGAGMHFTREQLEKQVGKVLVRTLGEDGMLQFSVEDAPPQVGQIGHPKPGMHPLDQPEQGPKR